MLSPYVAKHFISLMPECDQKHVYMVSRVSVIIGRKLGMSESELDTLREAAMLHDLGKTKIDPKIINKDSKLTDEEYDMIKKHSKIGHDMIKEYMTATIDGSKLGDIVLQHHERVDGLGYPDGLKDKDISLKAKIISVADVLDAILSDRPYKKADKWEYAIWHIVLNKGYRFDNNVVSALIQCSESIKLLYASRGKEMLCD